MEDTCVWCISAWNPNSAVIITTKQNAGKLRQKLCLWGRGGDRQLAQLIQSIKAKHIANNCLLLVCERLLSLVLVLSKTS